MLLLLITTTGLNAQTAAQDHFPGTPGYKWIYKNVFLDTLNQPVDTGVTYRIDSFALSSAYKGKDAKFILGKSGPGATLSFQPYIDTGYVNTTGNDGNVYFTIGAANQFAGGGFDSLLGQGFLNLLKSFQNWYTMYKFTNTVNSDYQVFRYDTTVTVDTITLPLRFDVKERRLSDASLNTELGTFTCKRFMQTFSVSYLTQILPPPFPPVAVPLLTRYDSTWIAPARWIVQSVSPTVKVDLSLFNGPKFSIPGNKSTIALQLPPQTGVTEREPASQFVSQVYPNPGKIASITVNNNTGVSQACTIKIYDVRGSEVSSGKYELMQGLNRIQLPETEHLSAAFYTVSVQFINKLYFKKFIKS